MADMFRSTDGSKGYRLLTVKATGERVLSYQKVGSEYVVQLVHDDRVALMLGRSFDTMSDLRRRAAHHFDAVEPPKDDYKPDLGARERTKNVEHKVTVTKRTGDLKPGDKVPNGSWGIWKDDPELTITEIEPKPNDWGAWSVKIEGDDQEYGAYDQEFEMEDGGSESESEPELGEDSSAREIIEKLAEKLGVELKPDTEDLESEVRKLREQVEQFSTEGLPPLQITTPEKKDIEVPSGTYHKDFPDILAALGEGEHVMLVGPAGSGKSTLAKQAWEALGSPGVWSSISCNPTMTETALKGFIDANGVFRAPPQYGTYTDGGVLLVDEVDGGSPGVTTGMNQMLSNDTYAFANGMADRHPDFVVCATGNTFGRGADRVYVGRNALDAATLDRFTVIEIGYDEGLEDRICQAIAESRGLESDVLAAWLETVRRWRKTADDARINVVISPRTMMKGVKFLGHGWDFDKIAHRTFAGGLSNEQLDRLGIAHSV